MKLYWSFIPNIGLGVEIKHDNNKHRYGTVVNKARVFLHDFEVAATGCAVVILYC
jgi:hypothetical protein